MPIVLLAAIFLIANTGAYSGYDKPYKDISNEIYDEIHKFAVNLNRSIANRDPRTFQHWLNGQWIVPFTKWCGPGNVAKSYHDLGVAQAIDACCRRHDFCNMTIKPGHCSSIDEKYVQCNHRSFTMSHCSCDNNFENCLDNIDSNLIEYGAGQLIKYIFFGTLGLRTQCFNGKRMSLQWKKPTPTMYTDFEVLPERVPPEVTPEVYSYISSLSTVPKFKICYKIE